MSQLVFAYGVGMLALVSPCGFTMLPAFLAYNIADTDQARRSGPRRLSKALAVGLAVSAGFAGTFLISGLLVSAGLRSLVDAVPWFGVVVGSVLVVLGLSMLAGRRLGMRIPVNWLTRPGAGTGRTVAFGAGYALTQLACGMAGLLAVVAQGMANSSIVGTGAVFFAFCAGATSLLVLLVFSGLASPRAARAHPLDVYLQATYITVGSSHLDVELDLTPGVLVAPALLPELDTSGMGQSRTPRHAPTRTPC